MSSEKKRVQSRTPHRLVDRTDALADVLGEDRTDILVTALPSGTAVVPAKRVLEAGSPCLKEPPKAASRQG